MNIATMRSKMEAGDKKYTKCATRPEVEGRCGTRDYLHKLFNIMHQTKRNVISGSFETAFGINTNDGLCV